VESLVFAAIVGFLLSASDRRGETRSTERRIRAGVINAVGWTFVGRVVARDGGEEQGLALARDRRFTGRLVELLTQVVNG
jgi:hypothetical protein